MLPAHSFYEEKIAAYTIRLQALQKQIAGVSILRLLSFLGLAIAGYYLLRGSSPGLLAGTLFFLVVFIGLVVFNLRLKDRRALSEKLLFVNTNESGLLSGQLNGFPDGKAFLKADSYLDDLDIFGPRSLFHLLNRTTSVHGTQKLADLLCQPLLSPGDILRQQEALKVLTTQADTRQLITAHGLLTGENEGNLYDLADWLKAPDRLKKWVPIVRWIIVLFNLWALTLWAVTGNYHLVLTGVLAGWILTGFFSDYMGQQHSLLSKKNAILEQYALTLRLFNTMDPGKASLLEELQAQTREASRAIRKLARISSYFDQQLNPVVSFLLNNLFTYNLHGLIELEKWKALNRTSFPRWIEAVGNIECLNSLASFAFNNSDYCYPVPLSSAPAASAASSPGKSTSTASSDSSQVPIHASAASLAVASTLPASSDSSQVPTSAPAMTASSPAGDLHITAMQLSHPLIPAHQRIPNDFTIGSQERLILVTGSNMSGKTTFLRTTGVNLLLAQCGAPVCAKAFSFTPMQLLTSLRVSDSLQEQTSYFMAELKKLQQIIHRLQEGRPALVLIDEILRGTNSEDKTYGSEQFIRKLLLYPCLSLFATHDLSLGQLREELPDLISNYCFESVIEQDELHFNYKLQTGIARNRNASFLMKKMEII